MPWPIGQQRAAPARSKLTPAQVVEIRIRYADGNESQRQIAADGKVSEDETEDYLHAIDQLRELLRRGYELSYAE